MRLVGHPWTCLQAGDGGGELGGGEQGSWREELEHESSLHKVLSTKSQVDLQPWMCDPCVQQGWDPGTRHQSLQLVASAGCVRRLRRWEKRGSTAPQLP